MGEKTRSYDFAGWVTKNDVKCADGVTILHNAFQHSDGQRVPLVWNHDYNTPENVLGHVILENKKNGVYGYGYFNDTSEANNARELVKHGDISSMSIGAKSIKRSGSNVIHGLIYEVSLVLSGANPGAMIDSVVSHSDDGDTERGIVYTGSLIHTPEDIPENLLHGTEEEEPKEDKMAKTDEKSIGQILEGLTPEQQEAMNAIVGMAVEEAVGAQLQHSDQGEEDEELKQNVFNRTETSQQDVIRHSLQEVLKQAADNGMSLKKSLEVYNQQNDDVLQHGINSIEMLFPEAAHPANGNVPILYKDPNTSFKQILNAITKSPFSRVKITVADLTEDEARAKGYITGNMKKEQFFSLMKRVTTPQTVYKKQKLDRDDILDIEDFDVVRFINGEMREMLEEEIARAVLVGDGREIDDEDKINESNIRPIIKDNDFFTIKKQYTNAAGFIEAVIKAMSEYRGSGLPTMYIDPSLLTDVKLLKGTDGRFLFGDIPSTQSIAARLGLAGIVETSFMVDKGALIVNLRDYTLGASKGGQITTFDDFDIDFNQYKYLIETRLSGSLTMPKSAIHLGKTKGTGASNEEAGITWGKRQADREAELEDPEDPGAEG